MSVGSALFFGYSYFRYLTAGFSPWYVLGAALLFSACSALQVFLAKGPGRRTFVVFLEAAMLMISFILYDGWQIIGVTALIVFAVLLWGYFVGRGHSRNSVEVQFFNTTRNVLGKVTTALLLFMILVYAPGVDGHVAFMPQQTFATFFDWSSGFLNTFYPNIPFTGSFGAFSESFAKMELAGNPTFQTMSQLQQSTAVTQATEQLTQGIKQATGLAPTADEPMSEVAYRYVIAALGNLKEKFQDRFIIVWAALLFIVLRSIGVIFVWLAQFVSLIIYEILLAAGFMHIGEAVQTKEVVEY